MFSNEQRWIHVFDMLTYPMRSNWRLPVWLRSLAPILALACASGGDAVSRQLISISHIASSPIVALSIDDEGRYEVVDSENETATPGALSLSELQAVRTRVASPRLEQLYEERSENGDACAEVADGYLLTSRLGTACFIASTLSGRVAPDLVFFVDLLTTKADTD